jgi:tryptophanyl-tRNA synthetase
MSLDDASKKMSKSNPVAGSYISMLDSPDVIRKKISRAVTDSGREVIFDPAAKPEISNLIGIFAQCANIAVTEVEERFAGLGYGPFKKELAEQVVAVLEPIQQRYLEIRETGEIYDVLSKGAYNAAQLANRTLTEVKRRMGFLLPPGQ